MGPANVSVLALISSTALFVLSAKKYLPVEFSTQLMSKLVGFLATVGTREMVSLKATEWSLAAANPAVTARSTDTPRGAKTADGSFDQEQIRQGTGLPRGRIDRALLAGGVDGIRFSACVHDQVEGVVFN